MVISIQRKRDKFDPPRLVIGSCYISPERSSHNVNVENVNCISFMTL